MKIATIERRRRLEAACPEEVAGRHGWIDDVRTGRCAAAPGLPSYADAVLSAENGRRLWIPEGFAHGLLVLSDEAEFLFKTTDYWRSERERCIRWDDPELAIAWPAGVAPVVSAKDAAGLPLAQAPLFDGPEPAP